MKLVIGYEFFKVSYRLMKYGMLASPSPTNTMVYTFVIKYGKIKRPIPAKSGTIACCFLPYEK